MTHPQTQDDEALIEVMAEALEPFFSAADKAYGEHRDAARAALTALRNHEGRKG